MNEGRFAGDIDVLTQEVDVGRPTVPMFYVRVVFDWQGEEVAQRLGPLDRYFADLVCVGFATDPFMFGITPVRVLRARVVPASEVKA